MHWRKITLAGVGLLGGSLGLAIKQRRLAARVEGFVRRSVSIAECEKFGVVDHATRNLGRAVVDANLIVLCTPISQMRELAQQMLPALKPGAVVTDVGSVKGGVIDEVEEIDRRRGRLFCGQSSHGWRREDRRFRLARGFVRRAVCLVTPTPNSNKDAVEQVCQFWQALGGRLLKLPPNLHDDLVSRASHLPHVVAAELANYILSPAHATEQARRLRQRFPRHHPRCIGFARNVARHRAGQPQKPGPRPCRVHRGLAGIPPGSGQGQRQGHRGIFREGQAAPRPMAADRAHRWSDAIPMLPDLIEIIPLAKPVKADITVPGSKSITNRALILAALADGEITLRGALWSEDTQVMTECLQKLGFEITVAPDPDEFCNRTIEVRGLGGKIPNTVTPDKPLELFVGNAGTAARFLSAFVCLGGGVYRLHGIPRMHERPQAALFKALRELGYRVESEQGNDKLPVIIYGQGPRDGEMHG